MIFFLVPVLTGTLPNRLMFGFSNRRFLNQKRVNVDNANIAGRLIDLFLARTQELYKEGDMLFNLHVLGYIQAHVLWHGPLWASNAHCFEDGNGILKRFIHSNQGVPEYVLAVKKLASTCKFTQVADPLDERLRDRFIAGMRSFCLRERLTESTQNWQAPYERAPTLDATHINNGGQNHQDQAVLVIYNEPKHSRLGSSQQQCSTPVAALPKIEKMPVVEKNEEAVVRKADKIFRGFPMFFFQ